MSKETYYPNLGAALADKRFVRSADFGSVDQGSYKYSDDPIYGPAVPTEIIRQQAEEAEAQYDKTMQTRREAEQAEAQYDKNQADTSKKVLTAVVLTALVVGFIWWISSHSTAQAEQAAEA